MFLAGSNEFGEATRAASHDHRPKPLRVARIASLEGGMTMSRKPSTAALDSFRRSSFRIRRRAPRHPAGESIRLSSGHGFTGCRKTSIRHSERSLRSEGRFCIARLLCDESLFSWVSAREKFLASLGMKNQTSFPETLQTNKEQVRQNSLKSKSHLPRSKP